MRGKSFFLRFVLLPCGHAVLAEGDALLPTCPCPLLCCRVVLDGSWKSQPHPGSRAEAGVTGAVRLHNHWGPSGLHTCLRDLLVLRSLLLTRGDVSSLPLLLGLSVGTTVSWDLCQPGASWQNVGFLSTGTIITHRILITLPIMSCYLQLERISRTLGDLTLLTIINPLAFDSNQSLESF